MQTLRERRGQVQSAAKDRGVGLIVVAERQKGISAVKQRRKGRVLVQRTTRAKGNSVGGRLNQEVKTNSPRDQKAKHPSDHKTAKVNKQQERTKELTTKAHKETLGRIQKSPISSSQKPNYLSSPRDLDTREKFLIGKTVLVSKWLGRMLMGRLCGVGYKLFCE